MRRFKYVGAFLAASVVVATGPGCSSDEEARAGLASGCKLNTDCNSPLVCSSGLCHSACVTTRDCPVGTLCVKSNEGKVCQLADETKCTFDSDCVGLLVCGNDGKCRNECQADRDCIGPQVCATGGFCAEQTEVDSTGALKNAKSPDSGSPGGRSGSGGAPGSGGAGGVDAGIGGTVATGGATASGGTGGLSGSGGAVSSGGSAGAGGASSSGGAGGTATGGAGGSRDAGTGGSGGAVFDGGASTPPSCAGGGDGLSNCGVSSESCCASLPVAGATFYRSYDGVTTSPLNFTKVDYPATVSDFRLDKFEITVGRFRKFKKAWDGGSRLANGSGKHTHLNGGNGLTDSSHTRTYEQGWDPAWTSNVAPTDTNLRCDTTHQTWTPTAGANERKPITCANWYELAAFCIWDGGFLPSEAEWNYAAAGGTEQRVFPWSSPPTSTVIDCSKANYYTGAAFCGTPPNTLPNDVGQAPDGAGKYLQVDLGGNVWEVTLDWHDNPYDMPCIDCAFVPPSFPSNVRVMRGGTFQHPSDSLLASWRQGTDPVWRVYNNGARCARTP